MTFVFFIIIVVVVMQTAFAHVRSSTSAQELENAEFLDAFKSLQESILAQIPKKEARLKTSKLIGAKDVSAESFQISGKRGGKMYTSGWAYNVTKSVKDCNSGNVQYITARPLYCKISPNHMNPDSPNSFAEMCFWDRNRKTIEYRAGYWTGSTNCNNYNTPPDTINDSEFGIGPYCNLDENGFGVFSGCGNRRYIQPADSPEDESIVLEFYGGESEDCEMELPPEILQAFPLNGCIQTPKKKGKTRRCFFRGLHCIGVFNCQIFRILRLQRCLPRSSSNLRYVFRGRGKQLHAKRRWRCG